MCAAAVTALLCSGSDKPSWKAMDAQLVPALRQREIVYDMAALRVGEPHDSPPAVEACRVNAQLFCRNTKKTFVDNPYEV